MFFKRKVRKELPDLEVSTYDVKRGRLYYNFMSDSPRSKKVKSPLFPERGLKNKSGEK